MVVDTRQHDCDEEETPSSGKKIRQKTLMEKLDVPVKHLDFKFVENCTDAREIEKVLRILRSGEEGYYPEFQDFVEKKLEELNPRSRHLRVETPARRTNSLETPERLEIENDISTWLGQCKEDPEGSGDAKNIFHGADIAPVEGARPQPPIRGTVGVTTNVEIKPKQLPGNEDNFLKPKNPNRIKSWDYDKWDKFNVDAELTKMEIEDMREEESQNSKKCVDENTSKEVGELRSTTTRTTTTINLDHDDFDSPRPSTSQATNNLDRMTLQRKLGTTEDVQNTSPQKPARSMQCNSSSYSRCELGPSFIEEISAQSENYLTGVKFGGSTQCPLVEEITQKPEKLTKKEGKRFKVIIDDLRMA